MRSRSWNLKWNPSKSVAKRFEERIPNVFIFDYHIDGIPLKYEPVIIPLPSDRVVTHSGNETVWTRTRGVVHAVGRLQRRNHWWMETMKDAVREARMQSQLIAERSLMRRVTTQRRRRLWLKKMDQHIRLYKPRVLIL